MARTVWGNILELMAATGLHGAMNLGTQLVTQPMIAKRQAQQQVLESLIPAMGTEKDPAVSGVIADKIRDISGVDLRTGLPEANAGGFEGKSSTGQALTIPKGTPLEALAPGVQTQTGFIRPKTTSMLNREASVEATRANLLANLAARRENLQDTLEARAHEGELNRLSREDIARNNQGIRLALGQMAEEGRQSNRQFMQMYLQDRLDEMKRRGATQEEMRELSQFTALQNQIGLATGDQKKTLQTQMNKMIEGTKNPMLKSFPMYMEDQPIPGTGYNIPLIGEIGAKKEKVPVGTGAKQTQPTANSTEDQFKAAYAKNPQLAIENAKRLGVYDKIKHLVQ